MGSSWSLSRWSGLWGALFLLAVSGCSTPAYLMGLARGQAKILAHRIPLEEVLRDPPKDLSKEELEKLRVVPEVKAFSARLGLKVEDLYRGYSPLRDLELWVVSASERLRLDPYLWRWPLVGSIPYKGFFSKGAAQGEAQALRTRGLDVHLRRVPAYSTIGWFQDPILPQMLRGSEASFVGLLIHEAVHATLYRPHHPTFNEGVAAFIERKGVELFLRERYGTSSEVYQGYLKKDREERAFLQIVNSLHGELENLYSLKIPETEKLSRRRELFDRYLSAHDGLRRKLERERRETEGIVDLNNAYVLAYRLYFEEEAKLEGLYRATQGDLRTTLHLLTLLARRDEDPFRLIEEALGEMGEMP